MASKQAVAGQLYVIVKMRHKPIEPVDIAGIECRWR